MAERLVRYAKANRKRPTKAEAAFWQMVRGYRLGVKFRRQEPVRFWLGDFYCAPLQLIVEIDGSSHDHRAAQDARRTRGIESLGFRVIRFTNAQVLDDPDTVRSALLAVIDKGPPPKYYGWLDPESPNYVKGYNAAL